MILSINYIIHSKKGCTLTAFLMICKEQCPQRTIYPYKLAYVFP